MRLTHSAIEVGWPDEALMLITGNMVLLSDMQQEWMFTCQNIGYEKKTGKHSMQ